MSALKWLQVASFPDSECWILTDDDLNDALRVDVSRRFGWDVSRAFSDGGGETDIASAKRMALERVKAWHRDELVRLEEVVP